MYKLLYSKRFEKEIRRFPQEEQIKIINQILSCASNPRQYSIKLATTKPSIYRIRAGEYRIFFELDNPTKTMIITKVERRTTQTYR